VDARAFPRSNLRKISITEGNRSLRLSGDFLLDFESVALKFYFGRDWEVTIAQTIETLCDSCFAGCHTLSSVIFEPGSRLSRIENEAFRGCTVLASICIPSSVETLGGSCFWGCRSLSTLTFESDSRLLFIGPEAFWGCFSLLAICLPSRLRELDSMALVDSNLRQISIADGNCHFTVFGPFLMDFDCISILHSFGTEPEVTIGRGVKQLGSCSFARSLRISSVIFETGSALASIGATAFMKSSLLSICIPSSVGALGALCFSECRSLSTVTFEAGSKFRRVGSGTFRGCSTLSSKSLANGLSSDATLFWLSQLNVGLDCCGSKLGHLRTAQGLHQFVCLLRSNILAKLGSMKRASSLMKVDVIVRCTDGWAICTQFESTVVERPKWSFPHWRRGQPKLFFLQVS
jgi:hypothetical protein